MQKSIEAEKKWKQGWKSIAQVYEQRYIWKKNSYFLIRLAQTKITFFIFVNK